LDFEQAEEAIAVGAEGRMREGQLLAGDDQAAGGHFPPDRAQQFRVRDRSPGRRGGRKGDSDEFFFGDFAAAPVQQEIAHGVLLLSFFLSCLFFQVRVIGFDLSWQE
jgi:hypothetical protein